MRAGSWRTTHLEAWRELNDKEWRWLWTRLKATRLKSSLSATFILSVGLVVTTNLGFLNDDTNNVCFLHSLTELRLWTQLTDRILKMNKKSISVNIRNIMILN